MSIRYDDVSCTFVLETAQTAYIMRVGPGGHLLHFYYGRRIGTGDPGILFPPENRSFSPNYYQDRTMRTVSPDTLPQEYTGCNVGDFRLSCLEVTDGAGARGGRFCLQLPRNTRGQIYA